MSNSQERVLMNQFRLYIQHKANFLQPLFRIIAMETTKTWHDVAKRYALIVILISTMLGLHQISYTTIKVQEKVCKVIP